MKLLTVKRIAFLLMWLALFGNFAFAQNASASNSLFGNLWSNIISFFGLEDSESSAPQDDAVQPSQNNIYDSTDFVGSNMQNVNTTNSNSSVSQKITIGNSNMACLPAKKHSEESYIIRYKCPHGTQLKDSTFGASANRGVVLKTGNAQKEYIDCESDTTNTVQRFECLITVSDPLLGVFAITPSNPSLGEQVRLDVDISGVENCVLTNSDLSIRKAGVKYSLTFKARSKDTFNLRCTDKTGLIFNKTLSY